MKARRAISVVRTLCLATAGAVAGCSSILGIHDIGTPPSSDGGTEAAADVMEAAPDASYSDAGSTTDARCAETGGVCGATVVYANAPAGVDGLEVFNDSYIFWWNYMQPGGGIYLSSAGGDVSATQDPLVQSSTLSSVGVGYLGGFGLLWSDAAKQKLYFCEFLNSAGATSGPCTPRLLQQGVVGRAGIAMTSDQSAYYCQDTPTGMLMSAQWWGNGQYAGPVTGGSYEVDNGAIAVDDLEISPVVYFVDSNTRQRLRVVNAPADAGGGPPAVMGSLIGPTGLVAEDIDYAFFSDDGDGTVIRCGKSGDCSDRLTLKPQGPKVLSLRLQSTFVYWLDAAGRIARCSRTGCAQPTPILDASGAGATSIAVGQRFIYIGTRTPSSAGQGAILKVPTPA